MVVCYRHDEVVRKRVAEDAEDSEEGACSSLRSGASHGRQGRSAWGGWLLRKLLLLEAVVPTLLCMSSYLGILLVEYTHDLRGYFRIMSCYLLLVFFSTSD